MRKKNFILAKRLAAGLLAACLLGSTNIVFSYAEEHQSPLVVQDLLTNGVDSPEAIDPGSPLFSWEIQSNKRGCYQTAYQIIVTENLSGKQVWDSGKVDSNQSSYVSYSGPTLASDTEYDWKVRTWDNFNNVSEYSSPSSFRIGLNTTEWQADYIWDGTENQNNFAYFRKSFQVNQPIKQAVVYTSAHNDYQLYVNGNFVGVGPARSDPYTYGQYCAYDITGQLQEGENVFASLAHWHGAWSDSGVNASPAYILEAHITYEDGSTDIIKTDDTWKVSPTNPYKEEDPVYFGHYGGVNNRASIYYDSQKEMDGWNTVGFDDQSWQNATVVDRSNYQLYAQLVSEEKEKEWMEPVSITQQGDKWLVDFGKCLTGWPELKLHNNAAGSQVKIQYWEVEQGWGDAGYDTYVCSGGEETFKTPYVRHTSFRLLEISGYQGELTADDVKGIVAYSDVDLQGSFQSSDERLNAVFEMCERSSRQNIQQGIISVDANREQSPWTADSWNIGIGYLYNHANTMVIDKVIKDYAGEQLASGNFLTCSPARDFMSEMPEWSMYWPMMLWEQYLFSGNANLLQEYYPNLIRFMDYMERYYSSGTGLYNPPGSRASDYAGGSLENGGDNIATNSQLYMNFNIASNIAKTIGNDSDADHYAKQAEELKQAINRNLLVNGEKYKTSSGSGQTHPLGTAWALRSGVVPEAFYDRVVTWLAKQKNNYDVGGYGGDALYNGLYTAGLGKIATQDFARYDTMLSTNNTNWESFGELSIDNMGNHAWTAYPSYILPRYVGGIHPSSGGFETVDIKPVTGGLEWARTSIPTIKGTITTNWNVVSENQFTMEVTIPANVTAKIYVPDNDMDQLVVSESGVSVFENNHFISGVDGLQQAEKQDGYIIFTAGSGTYSFQVTGEPLHTPDIGKEEETGVVIDDDQATYTNEWVYETASNHNDRYGDGFHYIGWVSGEPTASATYTTTIEEDGEYDVFAWWGVHSNRATNTPYTIHCGNVTETIRKNQEINGGQWNLLGTYTAKAGDTISIVITNDADEYVIADAVRIAPHQDADDTFTPLQQLQLLVYQMELADTSNCIDEIYAEQFKQVLAHAQELCDTQSQDETEITKTITDLQTAYDQMMANKKVNLALNQSVSASESVQSPGMWGTEYLTDGYKAKDDAGRIGYTTDAYHSQVLENPIDITLNLGQQQQVNQVVLYPRLSVGSWEGKTANFPTDYEIQVSNDGTNFQTVVSVQNQPDPMQQPVTCQFDSTTAQYIRIHVTKLGEYAAGESIPDNPTPYRLQFTEIEVYNVPVSEQTTNKSILKTVIKYAENAKASEEYDNAIELVQKSFDTALENAKAVANNATATQEEVNSAWQTLLNEIHKLGFIAGDKTALASLIEAANGINAELDRYVEAGKAEFTAALEAAQNTYNNGDAMQAEINEVADNLLKAMLNLRYKADKTILEEVIAEAGKVDANVYTAESYAVLTAAVNDAKAVMENENATQEEVDTAVANVQSAMNGLVAIEETATETPSTDNNTVQTGQESTTTKSNAAKTGDFAPIVSLAALGLSSAALLIFRKKK